MYITQNMGLTAWDLNDDYYDHTDLSNNFQAIDIHDHTPGHGKRIVTSALADGLVTTVKLGDDSVNASKIINNSITEDELAPDSVGSSELQPNSVGTDELQDGSVTSDKLDDRLLPLGIVVAWDRATPETPLPSNNWAVCDGSNWSSIPNAWGRNTGQIRDLRGKFIIGAGLTNNGNGPNEYPAPGATGGSNTKDLSHGHTVNSHTHTTRPHTHGISLDGGHVHGINADGNHNHGMHSRLNALLQGIQVSSWDLSTDAPIRRNNSLQSVYVAGFNNGTADDAVPASGAHAHGGSTQSVGGHSHGGYTESSANAESGASAPGTGQSLSSVQDIRPAYVGLIYIMKVR